MTGPQTDAVTRPENDSVIGSLPRAPHAVGTGSILAALGTTNQGITSEEAELRLHRYGPNSLPQARPASLVMIFLRQFVSPLIYVLVAAAVFSLVI